MLDTAVSACILSILYIYILLCVYNQERGALAFDTTVSMCKHSIICINHIYYYVYIHRSENHFVSYSVLNTAAVACVSEQ